jgi:hypothetical protein
MRATTALGSVAEVLHEVESVFVLEPVGGALEALLGVLARHPLSEAQLHRALSHWTPEEASAFLAALERSPEVKRTERGGVRFWIPAGAEFPPSPGAAPDK